MALRVGRLVLAVPLMAAFCTVSARAQKAAPVYHLLGFGLSSEADVTPDLIARYCVLKNFSMLYGLSWIAYAFGAAIGPVIVGSSFDRAGVSDQLHQAVFSALQGRCVSHSLPAAIRPTASR